jgi:uncharacterized damage-inducible protein DinB
MLYEFLRNVVYRHLNETLPLINVLTDDALMKKPYEDGKPVGEVILHMIRSAEFYTTGLATEEWAPLSYSLEEYNSAEAIKKLAGEVLDKVRRYTDQMHSFDLSKTIELFNRPATVAEILLEMIEHSIHHRGQITVYYRLLGIDVPTIPYII